VRADSFAQLANLELRQANVARAHAWVCQGLATSLPTIKERCPGLPTKA